MAISGIPGVPEIRILGRALAREHDVVARPRRLGQVDGAVERERRVAGREGTVGHQLVGGPGEPRVEPDVVDEQLASEQGLQLRAIEPRPGQRDRLRTCELALIDRERGVELVDRQRAEAESGDRRVDRASAARERDRVDREVELLGGFSRGDDGDPAGDRERRVDALLRRARADRAVEREAVDRERRAVGARELRTAHDVQLRDADRRRRWRVGRHEQPREVRVAVAGLHQRYLDAVDLEIIDHRRAAQQTRAIERDADRADRERARAAAVADLEILQLEVAEQEAVVDRAERHGAVHRAREPGLDPTAHERLAPRRLEQRERERDQRDQRDQPASRDAERAAPEGTTRAQNASPTRTNPSTRSHASPVRSASRMRYATSIAIGTYHNRSRTPAPAASEMPAAIGLAPAPASPASTNAAAPTCLRNGNQRSSALASTRLRPPTSTRSHAVPAAHAAGESRSRPKPRMPYAPPPNSRGPSGIPEAPAAPTQPPETRVAIDHAGSSGTKPRASPVSCSQRWSPSGPPGEYDAAAPSNQPRCGSTRSSRRSATTEARSSSPVESRSPASASSAGTVAGSSIGTSSCAAEAQLSVAVEEDAGRERAVDPGPRDQLAQQRGRVQHVLPARRDAQIGDVERVHVLDECMAIDARRDRARTVDDPAVAGAALDHEVVLRGEQVAQHGARTGERVDPRRIGLDPELAAQPAPRRLDDDHAHREVRGDRARHERAIGADLRGGERAARFGKLGQVRHVGVTDDRRGRERAGVEQRELGTPRRRGRERLAAREPGTLEHLGRGLAIVALDRERADPGRRSRIEIVEPRDRVRAAIDERAAVAPRVRVALVLQVLGELPAQLAIRRHVDRIARPERHERAQRRGVLRGRTDELDDADRVARALVHGPGHRDARACRVPGEPGLVDGGVVAPVLHEIAREPPSVLGEPERIPAALRPDHGLGAEPQVGERGTVVELQLLAVARDDRHRGDADLRVSRNDRIVRSPTSRRDTRDRQHLARKARSHGPATLAQSGATLAPPGSVLAAGRA